MRFPDLPAKRPAGGFTVRSPYACSLFAILFLTTIHSPLATILYAADPGVEFGAADDLSVMGVEGGAVDPDVEIKGFTVFGSTQASYPGAVTGPGNVVVNGYLAVSSGSYFAEISTFPAASGIFIADGNDKEVLAKDGAGPLKWTAVSELGDSLGSHVATTTLNMADFSIVGVSTISVSSITTAGEGVTFSTNAYFMNGSVGVGTASPLSRFDVFDGSITVRGTSAGLVLESADRVLSPETDAALGAGVRVSTNVYIVGFSSAAKYFGDGSSLTGTGDNLGSHIATAALNMGGYGILSSSGITAAEITAGRYLINGSTVLALSGSTLRLGVEAGWVNTGCCNIFVGHRAGYSNTTGQANTFLGRAAGNGNTTGSYNTFVGYSGGYSNTTGFNNIFLGYRAGYRNTTGGENNFMGYYAGYYNKTGSANVGLGHYSGYGSPAGTYSSSTIMGYKAGYFLESAGNLLVGYYAGYNITTGAGNIVVGYSKDTSAPAANNELNIGGLLYGDLSAKTIGISRQSPQAALDIVSTGAASDIYAQIWRDSGGVIRASMTSEGTLYAAEVFAPPSGAAGGVLTGTYPNPGLATAQTAAVSWSGAQTFNGGAGFPGQGIWDVGVGIGTSNPWQLLHLYSSAGDAAVRFQTGVDWTIGGDNSAGGIFKIAGSDALGSGDYVTINNSGDVGIGTANPGAKLEVAGQVKITGGSPGAGKTLTSDAAGLASWVTVAGDNLGNHTATTALNMADFNITGVSIIAASSITTALSGVTFSTNVYAMNGDFGVGTAAPGHKLDVAGAIYSRRYAAAADIDWDNGNTQSLTLTAAPTTLTFANGRDGGKYFLILKQDGTGSRTVAWPAEVRFPGGTALTLTTTAGRTDYIGFIYNGVDSKYDAVAFIRDL